MKKLAFAILGTAAFTGVSATTAFAGADVTVYGKVNVSINNFDNDSTRNGVSTQLQDNWTMNSNASRIGFKGKYDLTENTMAIYKLEYQVDIDNGTNSNGRELAARNVYAGITNKNWGTLVAGRHDSPLKIAQGKVDLFNDLPLGDIANILPGDNRLNNAVLYTTPKMGNVSASIMFAPGEQFSTAFGSKANDGLADSISASVEYDGESFWAALSVDSDVNQADVIRAATTIELGDFQLGLLAQQAEASDKGVTAKNGFAAAGGAATTTGVANAGTSDTLWASSTGAPNGFAQFATDLSGVIGGAAATQFVLTEANSYVLSGSYKIDNVTLKAQYGVTEVDAVLPSLAGVGGTVGVRNDKDFEAEMLAFGVDYKLTKNAKIYGYVSQLEYDVDTVGYDYDYQTAAVGWEFKF